MMTPEFKRVKHLQVEEREHQLSPGLKLLNGDPITPGSSLKGINELKRTPPRNKCTPSSNHGRHNKFLQDENFDPDDELTGELWYVNLKTQMEEPHQKLSFEPVDFAKVVDGKIPSGNGLSRSPVRMSQEEFCPRTPGNTDFEVREVVIEPGSRIPRTPMHYSGRPSAACDLVIHYSKNKVTRDGTNNSNKKEEPKSSKIKKPRKRSMSSNSIPVGEDDHETETGVFKTKSKLTRTPLKRLSMQPIDKPVQELQDIDENEPTQNLDCHSGSPKYAQIINENVLAESHDIFKPSIKLARSPIPPSKTHDLNSNNNYACPNMADTVPVCAHLSEDLECVSQQDVAVGSDSDAVPLCINATPETKTCSKAVNVSQVNSSSKIPRLSPKGNIQCESDINSNTQIIVVQTAGHDQMDIEQCEKSNKNQSFKTVPETYKLLNEESLSSTEHTDINLNSSELKCLSVNLSNDEPMRPLLSPAIKVRKPVKNMIPKGKSLMRTPPSGKYPRAEGEGSSIAPSLTSVEEDIAAPEDPDAIFLAQLRNNDPLPNKKKKTFLKSNKSKIVNSKLKKPAIVKTSAIDTKSSAETKPSNKIENVLQNKDRKLTYKVSKPIMTDNVEKENKISMNVNNLMKSEPASSSVRTNTLSKPATNNSRKLTYVVQPIHTSKECETSMQESDNSLLCLDELCDKSLNLCDSLFNEAFERKNSTNTNSKSTAVASFDSIICPPSPQEDFLAVENIVLGNTPSQSVPESKAVLNQTLEMEAKSESDEEFVDASEDLEFDNQDKRISTSPINRTFEISTPLSKSNSTFDLESKHNGTFDIEKDYKGKPSANQTFDVDMSPVHYNEAPVKMNDTFDLGKPLNTTFDMEVDDAIPKIVLNSTFDENQPLKCNKGAESPNQTLENTASTVVENITPNKTIETSSVCQTQDDAAINAESDQQQSKDESFASCNQSNSTSSDGRELSSSTDHGCLGQADETAVENDESNRVQVQACQDPENDSKKNSVEEVPKKRKYQRKGKKENKTAKSDSEQPSVETEDLEVEKQKKAAKRGRTAKVKVATGVLDKNSDKEACQANTEDIVHVSGQEDTLTVPKQRSYKKRGKKDANCADETEEENHAAPVQRRGRKPKIKESEHLLEQKETNSIQKTKRGREPTLKHQEQSSEHEDPESMRRYIEGSKAEIKKITTRRGRKPKAKVCFDTEESQAETQPNSGTCTEVPDEKIELTRKARHNKSVAKSIEQQDGEVLIQEDDMKQKTEIQDKESKNLHDESNDCLNADHKLKNSKSEIGCFQSGDMPCAKASEDHGITNEQPSSQKKDQFIKNMKPSTKVSRRHLTRQNQNVISYTESPNREEEVKQDMLKNGNNAYVCTSSNKLQNQGMEVEQGIQASDSSTSNDASTVVTRRKPAPRSKLLSLRASFGFVRDGQVTKAKDELVIPGESQSKKDKKEEPHVKKDETKACPEPVLSDLPDKISHISIHSPTKTLAKSKKMTSQTSKAKIKSNQEVEQSHQQEKYDEPPEKPATRTRRALPRSKKFPGSNDKEIKKDNSSCSETSTQVSERISDEKKVENTKETEDVQPQLDTAPQSRSLKQQPRRGRKGPTDMSQEAVNINECLESDSGSTTDLSENHLIKDLEKVLICGPDHRTNDDLETETNSKIAVSEKQENAIPEDTSNNNSYTNELGTEQIVGKGKVVCFAQESNSSENAKESDAETKKSRRRSGIPMGFLSKPTIKPSVKETFPGEYSKDQNGGDQKDNLSKENPTKSSSSKLDSMRKSFGIPSSQLPAGNKRLSFVCPRPTISAPESSMSRPKVIRSQSHKNFGSPASITSEKTLAKPSTKPGDIKALPDLKKGVLAQTLIRSTKAAPSTISERTSFGIAEVKTKKAITRTMRTKTQAKPEKTKTSPEPTRVRKTRETKKQEVNPATSIAKTDKDIIKKPATRIKKIPSRKNIRNASTSSIPSPTVCATHSQDSQETTIKVEQSNPRKRQKCDKQNASVPTKSIPTDELDQLNLGVETQESFGQASSGPEEMEMDQPSSSGLIESCGANMVSDQNQYRDVEEFKEDEQENKTSAAATSKKTKRLSFIPSFKGITSAISSKIKKKPTDIQGATNDMDNLKLSSPVKGKSVRKPRQVKDGATGENQEEAAPKKRGRKKKVVDEEKENENSTDVPESVQLPHQQTSARSLLAEQIQNVESELEMLTTSDDTTKKTESKISKLQSKLEKLKIKQESSKSKVCTRSLRSTRLKEQ